MKIHEGRIVYELVSHSINSDLSAPIAVVEYLKGAYDAYRLQEQLIVIPVNSKNVPYGRFTVSIGTANAAIAQPRDIFRPVILSGATAFILSHNHPSGNPSPSTADINLTRRLREAGELMQLDLLDHIIIGEPEDDPGDKGYYSFCETGIL